jgi:MFS family permease
MEPSPTRLLVQEWRLIVALAPGLLLLMVNVTLLSLVGAELTNALNSDRYRIQWIAGGYALGFMTGCMTTRLLSSQVGLSWCFWGSLLLFVLSAGFCGTVDSVFAMTPLRFLQGYGMGMALTSAMLLLWQRFGEHIPLWMALYGTLIFAGALIGAPLGGLLVHWLSWRWVFLIHFPVGAAVLLLAWFGLPDDRPAVRRPLRLDWIHLAMTLGMLLCVTMVLDMGQFWGWLDSPDLVAWLAGLVVFGTGFVVWGIVMPTPLISLRPLARPQYAGALLVKIIYSINTYTLIDPLSNYMIRLRGYQWWQGSVVLLSALALMLAAVCAGLRFGTSANRKARLVIGLIVMTVATWQLSAIDLYTSKAWIGLLVAVWGAGVGLAAVPVMMPVFEGLTQEQAFSTAGIFNITRFLPAFIIGATLGILMSRTTDAQVDRLRLRITHNRPAVSATVAHMKNEFTTRSHQTNGQDKQTQAVLGAWVRANARSFAFQSILGYLAGLTAAGAVLAMLVPTVGRPNVARRGTADVAPGAAAVAG